MNLFSAQMFLIIIIDLNVSLVSHHNAYGWGVADIAVQRDVSQLHKHKFMDNTVLL